jgi:hypothetical protein
MAMHMLAQVGADVQQQAQSWYEWLSEDSTGRLVGIGLLAVVGIIALVILYKSTKWAAARSGLFIGLAAAAAVLYFGSIWLFNLGPLGWVVAGAIAFFMLLGAALFMTHTK